jgi:hypothetical protein
MNGRDEKDAGCSVYGARKDGLQVPAQKKKLLEAW